MLKFSIYLSLLFSTFILAQAQNATDYSESSNPAAREYKVEEKSKKGKKESETNAVPVVASVWLPVMVVDEKGVSVDDLTATDFKVFVDDAEVKTSSFQVAGNQPLNVIFLIDMSPSADAQMADVKKFLRKLIGNLSAGDKISFITFDMEQRVLNPLTNDRTTIDKAFSKIEPLGGGTALYDAVTNVFNKRLPAGEKTIVVMITDGVDTVSKKTTYLKSLDIVRKYDVPVTTFYLDTLADTLNPLKRSPRISGIGSTLGGIPTSPSLNKTSDEQIKYDYAVGRNYLSEIAYQSGGSTFIIKDYSVLPADQISNLAKLIRPQYYLAFEPDAAKPQGNIKIRINRPQLKIKTRSRY